MTQVEHMAIPSSNQHQHTSDDYPPTRPGAVLVIIVQGLMVAILGIENWSDVSAFAHVHRIERSLGLDEAGLFPVRGSRRVGLATCRAAAFTRCSWSAP
jgi:hypothetical protein